MLSACLVAPWCYQWVFFQPGLIELLEPDDDEEDAEGEDETEEDDAAGENRSVDVDLSKFGWKKTVSSKKNCIFGPKTEANWEKLT